MHCLALKSITEKDFPLRLKTQAGCVRANFRRDDFFMIYRITLTGAHPPFLSETYLGQVKYTDADEPYRPNVPAKDISRSATITLKDLEARKTGSDWTSDLDGQHYTYFQSADERTLHFTQTDLLQTGFIFDYHGSGSPRAIDGLVKDYKALRASQTKDFSICAIIGGPIRILECVEQAKTYFAEDVKPPSQRMQDLLLAARARSGW